MPEESKNFKKPIIMWICINFSFWISNVISNGIKLGEYFQIFPPGFGIGRHFLEQNHEI